jgi:hypothetical protein
MSDRYMTREETERHQIFGYINNALSGFLRSKVDVTGWTEQTEGSVRAIVLKAAFVIFIGDYIAVSLSAYKKGEEVKVDDLIYKGPFTRESAESAMEVLFHTTKRISQLYRKANRPLTIVQKYMIQILFSEAHEKAKLDGKPAPTSDEVRALIRNQSKEWEERFEAAGQKRYRRTTKQEAK